MRARLWPESTLPGADLSSCPRIFLADMTAPLIRRASTGDSAVLARVGAELFAAAFAAQNDPNDLKAYLATAFAPRRQREELADPDRVTWIAESPNGDIAGYA